MSDGSYIGRGVAIATLGALLITSAGLYFTLRSRVDEDRADLIRVACLDVERGPMLRFENGLLMNSDAVVGTYEFRRSVAGKYGPSIQVEGVRVREAEGRIVVERGDEGWFWPFRDENTVEITYYPQNMTIAHRCTS